jgi:hypothetical protein
MKTKKDRNDSSKIKCRSFNQLLKHPIRRKNLNLVPTQTIKGTVWQMFQDYPPYYDPFLSTYRGRRDTSLNKVKS